ncbi:MAG: bifunctional phosphoribosyl-AMP cyclohydrolase/phosphoribosyl-ATP diphosphatase HisIE [Bacteroidetes bacterium]|nr:bifunctional phosphoribosyl-AMP cyclohydrolase/phosphoribosyl-ATP diphosphatase HisIE [Bacteroidota bacterium]
MPPQFERSTDGLLPVVIQDVSTSKVLMLGYMNAAAYAKTCLEKRVTFYSRSKQRLWTKGEVSGHYLAVRDVAVDCDCDTILIKVIPHGPVCHTGSDTCFAEVNESSSILSDLEQVIASRRKGPPDGSYTASLFASGLNRIAQKVGEEAVEIVIASKDQDQSIFLNEAADLLFHYLVLLQAKDARLQDVLTVLETRRSSPSAH